jgi:hypothetical protein
LIYQHKKKEGGGLKEGGGCLKEGGGEAGKKVK